MSANIEKTHFKKAFNTPYLGAHDLPDYKERVFTIEKVVLEKSKGLKENGDFNICYFKEPVKPMILNATNCKAIKVIANSPYINDWSGIRIQIGVQKVKAFGDFHDALRVRGEAKKESLTPTHRLWSKLKINAENKPDLTIEEVRNNFDISEDNFKLLID